MSACSEFRAMILEAEPPELRAEGDGPLAVHLRGCPDCARAAALVLQETAQLEEYLGDTPAFDVDAILKRAGFPAGVSETIAPRPAMPREGDPPSFRSFRGQRLWVPLAAAAAIAALLLMRGSETPRAGVSVAASTTLHAAAPLVEPVAGQDAAIMQTDDPDITVVWLFSTG